MWRQRLFKYPGGQDRDTSRLIQLARCGDRDLSRLGNLLDAGTMTLQDRETC